MFFTLKPFPLGFSAYGMQQLPEIMYSVFFFHTFEIKVHFDGSVSLYLCKNDCFFKANEVMQRIN